MQRWTVTLLLAIAASALAAPGNVQNVGENKNLDGDAGLSKRVIVGCGFVHFEDEGWVCICVDDEEGPFPADPRILRTVGVCQPVVELPSIEIAGISVRLAVTTSPNLLSCLSVKYFI